MTISPLDFTSLSDVSELPEAGAEEAPPPEPPPQAVRANASPARVAARAERREWRRFMAGTFFFKMRRQASPPPGPGVRRCHCVQRTGKDLLFRHHTGAGLPFQAGP